MKNLLSFLFCLLMLASFSDTVEAQNKTGQITTGNSYHPGFTFTASDTVAAGRTSYTIQYQAPQHSAATQDIIVKMDSISGPNISVKLQGSKFGADWTDIVANSTWAGTTADTTMILSNTTANRYRMYRIVFTRNAGKAAITDSKLKLYW